MSRLPRPCQLPLTMLTGKPEAGQRRLPLTPTAHLSAALASTLTGLLVSGYALGRGGWALLLILPGWAITLHGMRNLRMMVFHQCAHRNMWAKSRLDAAVGRMVAALLMVQHFERYRSEHVADHHARHHMTLRDPTVQAFLVSLELTPGMCRRDMWARMLGKIVSPKFHLAFLRARVLSYFHAASSLERVVTLGSMTAAGVICSLVEGGWVFLVVAWLIPLTVLYQISNTLRLCVKHTFPPAGLHEGQRCGRNYFASLTNAIFVGEAAPSASGAGPATLRSWIRWCARMTFIHFPSRYLVLTGDTVVHDFHHRRPMTRDWANYIFAREDDVRAGHAGWPEYRHVWGLVAAIDTVFASLSAADPDVFNRDRLAEVNHRDVFAAFDD
ncbi:stearoyl-CoA 9-desaturase [Jatrophihabitans sp.]|uniref:stearoyl-CoA 9-desaturase n=1 Tax=Jatrophihabitans sp. TaxID=1932789 RepID=UPI0038CD548A